jgi:hypothetical protein
MASAWAQRRLPQHLAQRLHRRLLERLRRQTRK